MNPSLQRWKCTCAYDGTTFAGWQSQTGGRAVQDVIEARLQQIFGGPVRIHGSGRTDAGVHATGMRAHIDIDTALTPSYSLGHNFCPNG